MYNFVSNIYISYIFVYIYYKKHNEYILVRVFVYMYIYKKFCTNFVTCTRDTFFLGHGPYIFVLYILRSIDILFYVIFVIYTYFVYDMYHTRIIHIMCVYFVYFIYKTILYPDTFFIL